MFNRTYKNLFVSLLAGGFLLLGTTHSIAATQATATLRADYTVLNVITITAVGNANLGTLGVSSPAGSCTDFEVTTAGVRTATDACPGTAIGDGHFLNSSSPTIGTFTVNALITEEMTLTQDALGDFSCTTGATAVEVFYNTPGVGADQSNGAGWDMVGTSDIILYAGTINLVSGSSGGNCNWGITVEYTNIVP